jgi:cysteine desulfurase
MRLEFLPVDKHGMAAPDDLRAKIGDDVAVVSIIHANNEIGTINPIQELGEVCRERRIPFHTDSVQGAAHLDLRLDQLHIDLLSLGAHKFHGPKGVGALYIRRGTAILPSQTGGAQEFGLRAGTHNVPLIVGMAQAFKLNHEAREHLAQRDIQMRDRIIQSVLVRVQESILTGHRQHRLPNHASFVFRGVNGNDLLAALDLEGYACSSGSACKTGEPEPSLVIRSLGLPEEWALGSLRVTVGRTNSEDQIDGFLQTLPKVIERLRVRA